MNDADKIAFANVLTATAEVYNEKLTKTKTKMYFACLVSLPIEAVTSALERHMADTDRGRFFPKPADILYQARGSEEEQALGAWAEFLQLIRRHGTVGKIEFDDEAMAYACMAMGGQREVGTWTEKQLDFKRPVWVLHYRAAQAGRKHVPVALPAATLKAVANA